MFSPQVSQALALSTAAPEAPKRLVLPDRATPMVVQISDPLDQITDVIDLLNGDALKARPNGWMQRNRPGAAVSRRGSGQEVFDGRLCCLEHMIGLDARLHTLRLPYETTCQECGAGYRVQMGVTQHG